MDDDPMEVELYKASIDRPRDSARYVAALERAVLTRLYDPETPRNPPLLSLYEELVHEYQVLGRWDDALVVADAVAEARPLMNPPARCLRARILMRMGRVAEAEQIWEAVCSENPEDVSIHEASAIEYADIGDHESALAWLTEGLQVALRIEDSDTEDPLAAELVDLRQKTLDELRRPADALQGQATATLRAQAEREHLETLAYFGIPPGVKPVRPTSSARQRRNTPAQPRRPRRSMLARARRRLRKALRRR
ncbi:hypothetical protein ACEWX3_24185 [Mycobacterium sp. G7A2]|uniref:hypothetical protein n=1 Tax=Mycobacterium sp. G7A2 TaxID=3317307 RepID=UPI0035A8DEA2